MSNEAGKLPMETATPKGSKYWSLKFNLVNVTIALLASIAGYLQYVAYPALMTAPIPSNGGTGFGESNVVLNLTFLTFQLNATGTCGNSPCLLKGVPAFDFCQGLIYLLILINLVHLYNQRTK
jgi:hypothetical protein